MLAELQASEARPAFRLACFVCLLLLGLAGYELMMAPGHCPSGSPLPSEQLPMSKTLPLYVSVICNPHPLLETKHFFPGYPLGRVSASS